MDNWFRKICNKLTKHRWRKLICWSVGIEPIEYHYKCKICGKRFWNYGRIERSIEAEQEDYMTNGDRIRQMTDEELAKLFEEREAGCCFCVDYVDGACLNISCRNGVLGWLNQEASE